MQQTATVTQNEDQQHFNSWPNLAGFNASVLSEDVRTPIALPIKGRFPGYVAGALYRTGPGAYKIPAPGSKDGVYTVRHWFDGFTTSHRFDLVRGANGCNQVLYSSKMQVEKLMETAKETGSIGTHVSFAQRDPCESLYRKVKSFFTPTGVQDPFKSNIGVVVRPTLPAELAGIEGGNSTGQKPRILTISTDNVSSKHFDADTLEPLRVTNQATIHPSLTGQMSAAHSAINPTTGDMFNYNLTLGPSHMYRIFRAGSNDTEILAEIQGPSVRGAYLHSLSLTENFVILCVWPAFFRYRGMSILWERNIADSIGYDIKAETEWFVIDRKHGRGVVKKFTCPSFFAFHFVNAWEERGDGGTTSVICDLCAFPDASILELLEYQYIVSTEAVISRATNNRDAHPEIARYRLPSIPLQEHSAASSTAPAEQIFSIPGGDLPNINPRYQLRQHRYVYTVLNRGKSSFLDGIGKTDMQLQKTTVWEQERHTPGEPIFIPRPGGVDEDDGVVLSVVLDGDMGTSYLLCLDARTFKEVARATVDRPVGLGFHGLHVSDGGGL